MINLQLGSHHLGGRGNAAQQPPTILMNYKNHPVYVLFVSSLKARHTRTKHDGCLQRYLKHPANVDLASVDLILKNSGPYLAKRKSHEEAAVMLQEWLLKCNNLKPLDDRFNPNQRINLTLKNPPWIFEIGNLESKYPCLYAEILLFI